MPTRKTEDGDGVLFELIAVFDDLLRAVKLNVPAEYAAVLGAVADGWAKARSLPASWPRAE